jgi:hypothetical protein
MTQISFVANSGNGPALNVDGIVTHFTYSMGQTGPAKSICVGWYPGRPEDHPAGSYEVWLTDQSGNLFCTNGWWIPVSGPSMNQGTVGAYANSLWVCYGGTQWYYVDRSDIY